MSFFARYDKDTGKVLSAGFQEDAVIDAEHAQGVDIIRIAAAVTDVARAYVDPATGLVTYTPAPSQPQAAERLFRVKAHIVIDLARTDYTQALDAPDFMTSAEIAAWRAYRARLRAARKLTAANAILAALPTADPDGADFYAAFRAQ